MFFTKKQGWWYHYSRHNQNQTNWWWHEYWEKIIGHKFCLHNLEEGDKAQSVNSTYSIATLEVEEFYEELAKGLIGICREGRDLEVLTVDGKV